MTIRERDLEGAGRGEFWGFQKTSESFWERGGGYFEYRLPGFPDFGPQSLATLHDSISSSSKQQPRQVLLGYANGLDQ